jgi:hypothetical protein
MKLMIKLLIIRSIKYFNNKIEKIKIKVICNKIKMITLLTKKDLIKKVKIFIRVKFQM